MPDILETGPRYRTRLAAAVTALALTAGTAGLAGENQPISDAQFAAIRAQYLTDHAKPDKTSAAQLQDLPPALARQVSAEKVTLEFKGRPTETFFIVTPVDAKGALQPVVYAPHADPWRVRTPIQLAVPLLMASPASDVVASGRALVIPVWEGSFDRHTSQGPALLPRDLRPAQWGEWMLSWHQTLAVVLDYLQSRPDMDAGRMGLLGYSFGSDFMAPSLLALEERIRAAVLVSAALQHSDADYSGMLDNAAYLPRVRIPVLMINGRYSSPYDPPTQNAAFLLLGTPAKEKQLILLDAGHARLPQEPVARALDGWFDRHLGPTR
jgi:pimeloyl-ACP methyl ester carboxylesterase